MPWSWWLSPCAALSFLGSSARNRFVLVIVDDNAGFRDEARALPEQHGLSVVDGMSTYDEREYVDLPSPAVGFLAKDRPVSGDDPTSRRRSLARPRSDRISAPKSSDQLAG